MLDVADGLSSRLLTEQESRSAAEKRTATLEVEREGVDAKWRAELEVQQSLVATLQADQANHATSLSELKQEIARLERKAEEAEREVAVWKSQTSDLKTQLEVERLEKQSARKDLQLERSAVQALGAELDALKAAHQVVLADADTTKARLAHVTSEAGKREVIEEYRHGPLGKVELSLAVKAGFDYVKSLIPTKALASTPFIYPPRVQNCLSVLEGLESRGAGVRLDVGGGDNEDGDVEDEDEDEDEGESEDGDGNGRE